MIHMQIGELAVKVGIDYFFFKMFHAISSFGFKSKQFTKKIAGVSNNNT